MTGSYAWHIGTLIDGQITTELPVVFGQSQWQLVMDDAGTLTVVAALSDSTVRGLDLYTSAEPARCFLALGYLDDTGTETFLEAGPIWTHSYDGNTRQLTIRASGLWSLWDHRMVLPVLSAGQSPSSVTTTYTGLSLGTIAKRLVALAQTHTGGSVPVALPTDETGTNSNTYPGYAMDKVGDMLRNLTGVEGGPEIQFVPRRQASDPTKLEWVMRVGTTEAPLLSQMGADWIWDLTAVKSSASGLKVTRDGSVMTCTQWVQGAGTDVSTLFGQASDSTLIDAGFPLLEAIDASHSGEAGASVQATLDAYAAEDLARTNRPMETWTITVQRDDTPAVGSYQVGDYVSLTVAGDYYVPDGTYRSRITGLSGDDTNQVSVALASTLGGA